jgi:anti-sigma-K factor RskA
MTVLDDDILDLLTAYALDALAPEEIAEVQRLLDERPDLRATVAELRATANQIPYGLPDATPPAELRQRTLDYATGRTSRQTAAVAQPPSRLRGWLAALGGIAAVAVLAAALGWGQVVALRGELAQSRTELARARSDLAGAQAILATLEGSGGKGTMVRTRDGATVFAVSLPQLQPGRTYQLWRIKDATPASAGLFTVDQQGLNVFNFDEQLQSGETVAVTDEPDGGSEQPTMQPLIAGKVQS